MTLQHDRQRLYEISEQEIRAQLEASVYAQAEDLYREGTILNPEIEDASLYGTFLNRNGSPSVAEVSVDDGEVYTSCTCNSTSTICEHVGALLLSWTHEPESFEGYGPGDAPRSKREPSLFPDLTDEYREILRERPLHALRDLAHHCDVEVHGTRKDPIVEQLALALSAPAFIRARLDALNASAVEVLIYVNLILDAGYGFTSESLVNSLLKRDARAPRQTLHRQAEALVEDGLLLKFEDEAQSYYMLPQAVRNALPSQPGFIPLYPAAQVSQLEVRERPAMSAIHTLYQVWHYVVQRQPRRESVRTRLPVEDEWGTFADWDNVPEEVDQIVRQHTNPYYLHNISVTVPAPRYRFRAVDREALAAITGCTHEELEFIYTILDSLAAISATPGDPIAHQSRVVERLLSLPPSTQMRAILYSWTHVLDWSEMDIVQRATDTLSVRRNLSYASFGQQDLYREWRSARQAVLRFLATIEEGEWVSIEGFVKTIHQVHPGMIHAHSDPAVWWLRSEKTRKQFGTTLEDWMDSTGRFVLATLYGPLSWLGAISLGYVGDDARAFRVTPLGSFALQRRASVVEQGPRTVPPGAVQLDDDLVARVVPNLVPAQLHDLFHLIGRLDEATPTQFRYRVTAEGVLHALEEGQTVDNLIRGIARWCGAPPPGAWRDQMARWSENYGKLHVYDDITLIELADDFALRELLSNTSLRDHVIHTFSPRLVAIHPGAVDDLTQEMEKRGYMPHVE